MITVGVVLATVSAPRRRAPASAAASSLSDASAHDTRNVQAEWLSESMQYTLGILLLSFSLVLAALLGLWQEGTYARYGKQWREGLFYSVSGI